MGVDSVDAHGVEDEELASHHAAWQDALVDGSSALLIGVPKVLRWKPKNMNKYDISHT